MSIFALKKEKKYIKRKPLNSGTCGQAVNSKSVCSMEVEAKGQEYRTLCGIWNKLKKDTPGAATPRESGK